MDGAIWFLLNASPDLRYQIESFPPLHPQASSVRHTPIAGIVLLSAEIDATLGLLLLREFQPLVVYATRATRSILTEDNSMFASLQRVPDQVKWRDITPGEAFLLADGQIRCTPVSAQGAYPGFVRATRAAALPPDEAVLGLYLEHANRRVAFFPGAARTLPEWVNTFATCDVIFFDGTFWSSDELICVYGAGKQAREMGHQPVSETIEDRAGSYSKLSHSCRKIFLHINNTNPILDNSSRQRQSVSDAGWEVAYDGMEFTL